MKNWIWRGKMAFASSVPFLNFTGRNSLWLFSAARSPSFWPSLIRVTSVGVPIAPHADSIFTTPRKTIDGSGAAWRLAVIVTKLRSSVSGRQKSMVKMQVLFRRRSVETCAAGRAKFVGGRQVRKHHDRLADLILVLHARRNRLTSVQHGPAMPASGSLG
jgi:hypothetical protein